MNCNIFKKKLEDYVLGNISNDLKIALKNHMQECENCRRLYEEEIKIDTAFKSVLSIDGIEFNSSRASIINSIDKNRYSKKTSNKVLYNFRKYKSRYLSYAVVATAMVLFIPIMLRGFAVTNYDSAIAKKSAVTQELGTGTLSKSADSNATGDSEKSNLKIEKAEANSPKQPVDNKEVGNEKNSPLQFQSSIITKQALPNYDISWKNSTDGKHSVAIDTRPESDVDFGIHVIYIKNINSNEIVKYEVINNEAQQTPRNIEWWNNEHLIIVTGFGYGTINYGSAIYSLDINTGEFFRIYQVKDQKYQILDVKKEDNDLILQLLIYNDDTYNTSHSGVGKMTLLELDKPVDMIIESEEKK